MTSPGWVDRYRRGEREVVWQELRQLGARVPSEHVDEVRAVCDEMARRARSNVEVLVARLSEQGYVFHSNDDERSSVVPFRPAGAEAPALVEWLKGTFGAVPYTVSSWLRLVGDVWLVGTHPEWANSAAADPLVVELEGLRWPEASMADFYTGELDAWREQSDADDAEVGGFVLPVSPDRLHKANVSGGAPYGFRLPDGCVDAMFVGEVAMPFVDYLNWCFQEGGFPGRRDGELSWSTRQELSHGLLPL